MNLQQDFAGLSNTALQLALGMLLQRRNSDPNVLDDLLVLTRHGSALAGKGPALTYEEQGALHRAIARLTGEMEELGCGLPSVPEALAKYVMQLQTPAPLIARPNGRKPRPRRSEDAVPATPGASDGTTH